MTVWVRWLPENDAAVRAAYDALGIEETIQASPLVLDDGSYLVGSSVLTMEQAATLPAEEAATIWGDWTVADG